MRPPIRTPVGEPNLCPLCEQPLETVSAEPPENAPCPHCGALLWFPRTSGVDRVRSFPVFSFAGAASPQANCPKEAIICLIVDRLIETSTLCGDHREGVIRAIMRREGLGSTGIGRGVAIPHTMYPGVDRLVGAVARFPAGIEFASLDNEPVYTVCLFVSPVNRPGDYLRLLEAAARQFRGEL